MYLSVLFESCGTCHHQFGQMYDKDLDGDQAVAQGLLTKAVIGCDHQHA